MKKTFIWKEGKVIEKSCTDSFCSIHWQIQQSYLSPQEYFAQSETYTYKSISTDDYEAPPTRPYRDPFPALKSLGVENVKKGMAAFGPKGTVEDWRGCFLAMVFGKPGELEKRSQMELTSVEALVRTELGISDEDMRTIIFDFDHFTSQFKEDCIQFLAENGSSPDPVMEEAHVGAA